MWKNQVLAAEMDVERLAQVLDRHRRAFDVPTGASIADLRLPKSFAWLRRLPECEVAYFFLVKAVRIHTRAIFDGSQRLFRKLAVFGKLRDAKIVRTVVCAVSESFFHQMCDEICHLVD